MTNIQHMTAASEQNSTDDRELIRGAAKLRSDDARFGCYLMFILLEWLNEPP